MRGKLTFLALGLCGLAQANVITQWNFNTLDGNGSTGTLSPSIGAGTVAPIGGVSSFFGFASGSSDPEVNSEDSAWGIGNLPPQGTASGTAGMEGLVSTVGFQSIFLSVDVKTQFSSSKYYQVQYRLTNGGAWNAAATYGIVVEDVWENQKTFDLSAINIGVENNAQFGFRIVAVFKPGTQQYAGMNDLPGSYGGFGTLNDMLTISGTPVPEPASFIAFGIGALGLAGFRRRNARMKSFSK